MAGVHTVSNITAGYNHGIQFLNDDWNESISNDQTFLLRWNSSISGNLSKDLGLFKVAYPANGTAVYSLYTNLTEYMESSSCEWKPHGLGDDLFSLWLSIKDSEGVLNWAVSPPWKIKQTVVEAPKQQTPWLAPFLAPVIALLLIYGVCLGAYWYFKRRRLAQKAAAEAERARRRRLTREQQKRGRSASTTVQPSIRSPSVNTVTVDILEENDPSKKPELWMYTAAGANKRRGSDDVVDSPLSDATLVEEHENAIASASVRFYR